MTLALKLTVLASLYLAQGLPYGFFTQALPVILREQGFSLKAISVTGLLYLPWLLKFLIAPYVDRSDSRRRCGALAYLRVERVIQLTSRNRSGWGSTRWRR